MYFNDNADKHEDDENTDWESFVCIIIRNIGVIFDSNMDYRSHVNAICKSCKSFFHIYQISRIRKYVSIENTKTLVHAFITCKLDSCNSFFYMVYLSTLFIAFNLCKIARPAS
jgi:hypothetical protein